jgi:1-aminocyclopropane-1-carboxylate deaminase
MSALFDARLSTLQPCQFTHEGNTYHFSVKRDDLIDELVSGNKWRKLRLHLDQVAHKNALGILTFGGAYSNHLVATAKACFNLGLASVGVVRGDELCPNSNSTLKQCAELGMELVFVDRDTYRNKDNWDYLTALKNGFPGYQIVPEGGSGFYGMIGCQDILKETPNDFSDVFLAAGTGTTAAGVLLSATSTTKVHVVSVLKGDFMLQEVRKHLAHVASDDEMMDHFLQRCIIYNDLHFGGYGKVTPELSEFKTNFEQQTRIPLDSVYTAKAAFGMINWMVQHPESNHVLFIHTGGRGITI